MSVAKITEIQSSSSKSFEDAIQKGIARAEKTLRNLSGAWIKSQKVVIEKGKIRISGPPEGHFRLAGLALAVRFLRRAAAYPAHAADRPQGRGVSRGPHYQTAPLRRRKFVWARA